MHQRNAPVTVTNRADDGPDKETQQTYAADLNDSRLGGIRALVRHGRVDPGLVEFVQIRGYGEGRWDEDRNVLRFQLPLFPAKELRKDLEQWMRRREHKAEG